VTDAVFHRELGREYPVASHSRGVYVYDTAGKRYLDGAGSVFVSHIGHGVAEIEAAIGAQMRELAFAHTSYFANEAERRFAEKLVAMAPRGFGKVWMTTSGAAANETAVKLARHYHRVNGEPERHLVIARKHAYHGSSLGALSLTGQQARREPYAPYLLDVPHIAPPNCYRCPLGLTYPACAVACADELEREIVQAGARNVSAFIVEPVSGGPLGALTPPAEYLPKIRAICDAHGVLLIVDEVITAAGRTGRNFAVDHWGVVPDLITCAKGIAGGYLPIGAVLVHERIFAAIAASGQSFRHGETFAGHAVMSAAGEAVLQYIDTHGLVDRAALLGVYLGQRLATLHALSIVGDVRGLGLLWGVELVRDKVTKAPFERAWRVSERIARECFIRGLLVVSGAGAADGIDGDTITLAPPLTIAKDEIDELVGLLGDAIRAVGLQIDSD
jgi:adenosylmethionine-8-amino-7-oxononanoate aminotransferase